MYTVIRTYTTSDSAEVAKRVREEFLPLVRDVPGFIGYYAVDGGDGRFASITVAEDQAGVEESSKRASSWVKDRLAELVTSGPDVLEGAPVVPEPAGA